MPYIYENDPTKIGTNLQTAVAYLLSLHKDQYEWNLLGIKVIGVKEALPIPDGDYDYGDAYMIGNETDGYEMWIYTRADEIHAEAYWFNVGAFPKPGPQGPKGDGLEQIYKWTNGTVGSITYDTTDGAKTTQTTTIDYTDSTDGSTKQQQFNSTTTFPIIPGKYVSMDATADNKKLEVKVDDTALALDYIKIDKTMTDSTPVFENGKINWKKATQFPTVDSIVWRNYSGDSSFHKLNFEYIGFKDGGSEIDYFSIYSNTIGSDYGIEKTPTDTGTLTNSQLVVLQHIDQSKNLRIVYDNQVYYRMDPQSAPDGTLNYIHLDSLQDGSGGYKLTAKCFSVTVSTRAWQVIDLSLAGYKYTHNLTIYDQVQDGNIYLSYVTDDQESYANRPEDLIQSIENKNLPCTYKSTDSVYSAGTLTSDGTYLTITYGSDKTSQMTNSQVTITDYVS